MPAQHIEMTIKNFGAQVVSVWEGLRPITKKMLVGALQSGKPASAPTKKYSYDAHADWELSRLLSALDSRTTDSEIKKDSKKLAEISQMADACALVLQAQTESAEVFIQLVVRALAKNDFERIDKLADMLVNRFPVSEIAEIIRQSKVPHISAIAYETLAMKPASAIFPLLDDSIYFEIARNVLEQQAFEFDNPEAQEILEEMDLDDFEAR